MRRLYLGIVAALLTLTGLATVGGSAAEPSSGVPDPSKSYQVRANCHNAYDLLFEDFAKGISPSQEEAQWATAYEAARGAGHACPLPPQSLLDRANGHVVSTEQGMSGVAGFASNQQDPVAMFEAGLGFFNGKFGQDAVQEGYDLISKAADKGDPQALFTKGVLIARGQIDDKADYPKALPLIEAAAKAGHIDAMFMAGAIAMGGQAGRKDPKVAFEWFRQAAERGHFYATYMAWDMLTRGEGTKKDFDLAYRLARRVAQDGQVYGAVMASAALLQGPEPGKHEDEILYWMDYAIRHGDKAMRDQMAPLRQQAHEIFTRPSAPANYQPRPFRACPMKTVCLVNHYSGLQSCTTNKDYWHDCDG